MNRIRRLKDVYQVLITPTIKIGPDSPIVVGNWEDEDLRNFYILEFPTLSQAECEAFKHPDIDWYRLVINHKHIFKRLETSLLQLLKNGGFTFEFKANLMDPGTLKNTMFDRVANGGERFNLRHGFNDLISFTIINPWTSNLDKMSKLIESHREHLYRDDLRIREKKIIDAKIICLYGITEMGTIYEIKLVPTILHHWAEWFHKYGFRNPSHANNLFNDMVQTQETIDKKVIR